MNRHRPLGAPTQALEQLYAAHWRQLVRSRRAPGARPARGRRGRAGRVRRHARSLGSRLRDHDKALAYLRQAVVNRSRSVLRHRVVVDRHLRGQSAPDDGTRSDTAALDAARRDAVLRALRQLPDRQREVLVLRHYLDLSEAQIADALGISPRRGEVTRTRAVRAALRELLGDCLEGRVMTDERCATCFATRSPTSSRATASTRSARAPTHTRRRGRTPLVGAGLAVPRPSPRVRCSARTRRDPAQRRIPGRRTSPPRDPRPASRRRPPTPGPTVPLPSTTSATLPTGRGSTASSGAGHGDESRSTLRSARLEQAPLDPDYRSHWPAERDRRASTSTGSAPTA